MRAADGMRRRYVDSILLFLLVLGLTATQAAEAQAPSGATLEFTRVALDLDSGDLKAAEEWSDDFSDSADIVVCHNADRTPHSVVWPVGGLAKVAVLPGVPYDSVGEETIASVDFPELPEDLGFLEGDTILVKTDTGAIFKLGNPAETESSLAFDYERLQQESE